MNPILLATIALALAQAPPAREPGEPPADLNAQRLGLMKESVQSYEFTEAGARATAITLRADPAFRLGRQANGGILDLNSTWIG